MVAFVGVMSLLTVLGAMATPAHAQTVQRSIEEFIAAQGTHCLDDGAGGCLLFVPPLGNFFGWSQPSINRCAAVDYAGIANSWIQQESGGSINFGTRMDGTVTERLLGNGQAEVSVRLHTTNALVWAINQCQDFSGPDLIFGNRAPDVLAGQPPSFAESFIRVVFLTRPNAPLPDLLQIAFAPEPGQAFTFLSAYVRGDGTFRAASGFADGTPGRITIVQTGVFVTPFMGAVGDGFPAEQVELKRIQGGRFTPIQ